MKRAAPAMGPPFFCPGVASCGNLPLSGDRAGALTDRCRGRFAMSRGVPVLISAAVFLVLAGSAAGQDCPSCLGGSVGPPPPPPPTGPGSNYSVRTFGSDPLSGSFGSSGSAGSAGSAGATLRPQSGPAVMAWAPVSQSPSVPYGTQVPPACQAIAADGKIFASERAQWNSYNCAQYYSSSTP